MDSPFVMSVDDTFSLVSVHGGESLCFLQAHWIDYSRNYMVFSTSKSFEIWDCRYGVAVWQLRINPTEVVISGLIDSNSRCITLLLYDLVTDS